MPLICTDPDGDPLTLSTPTRPSKGSLARSPAAWSPSRPPPASTAPTRSPSPPTTAPRSPRRRPSPSRSRARRLRRRRRVPTAVGTPVAVPLPAPIATRRRADLSQVTRPGARLAGPVSGRPRHLHARLGPHGQDSFTYRAIHGVRLAPATVTITITRPPRCDDVSPPHRARHPVSVPLTCSDPDGDALTLSIADVRRRARSGAVTADAVTYTPGRRRRGADCFTYRARRRADSAPATATITISRARPARTLRGRAATPRSRLRPADLPGPRRRSADALDRRRPVEGLAGRDRGRRGDLHARRRRVRARLVHLPADDGHGDSAPGHRLDHDLAPAGLRRRVGRTRGRRGRGAAGLHGSRRRRR